MAPDLARLLGQLDAGAQPRLADRFRLEARLGAGGMGLVLRAQDLELGRQVALKLLLRRSPKALARLRREASLATRISHPNVVRVFGLLEDEGLILVCELVPEARTLDEAWEDLDQPARLDLVEQVAAGLAAVHRAGVVHRDLKPSNVLVDAEGRARVTDFGLARADEVERLTATGTLVGTPHYMSPEQAQGRTQVDARADVWALGVILYQALTGELPFEGESLAGLLYAIGHSEARLGWSVPAPLRHVCTKALSKDLALRYADAAEFADALRAARQDSGSLRLPALASGVLAAVVLGAGILYEAAAVPSPARSALAPPSAAPSTAATPEPRYSAGAALNALALVGERLYLETDLGVQVVDLSTRTPAPLQRGKRLATTGRGDAEPQLLDAAQAEPEFVAHDAQTTLRASPGQALLQAGQAPPRQLSLDAFKAYYRQPLLGPRHAILVRGGLTNGASIRLWERASGEQLSLEGSDESYLTPRCAALSPAGRRLAVGCRSGLLAVFDLEQRDATPLLLQDPAQTSADLVTQLTPMAHARTLHSLAFPSEEELLSSDGVTLCLWDLKSGALREARPLPCRALAAQPSRGRVAYGVGEEVWVLPWSGDLPAELGRSER